MTKNWVVPRLFKFYFQRLPEVGEYFVKLDVLAPSFLVAMIFGYIFSKIYPPSLNVNKFG